MNIKDLDIDPKAKECLERGGSKAGTYFYLLDTMENLMPKNTAFLDLKDDNVEEFLKNLDYENMKIARGCHPKDFTGAIDVFKTQYDLLRGLKGIEEVREAIKQIREHAHSQEVKSYMEYETGEKYDGRVGVLVQDYNGPIRGSIVEHPHEQGMYLIERMVIGGELEKQLDFFRAAFYQSFYHFKETELERSTKRNLNLTMQKYICNREGHYLDDTKPYEKVMAGKRLRNIPDMNELMQYNFTSNSNNLIINIYEKVKESGLIPKGYSYKLDYGFNDDRSPLPTIYQATLFKKFEDKSDFDIDPGDKNLIVTGFYNAFGKTDSNGIELDFAELSRANDFKDKDKMVYFFHNQRNIDSLDHETYKRNKLGLDIMPNNMQAYLTTSDVVVLEHEHLKWIQKADIALATKFLKKLKNMNVKKVRILCNGIMGGVEIIK